MSLFQEQFNQILSRRESKMYHYYKSVFVDDFEGGYPIEYDDELKEFLLQTLTEIQGEMGKGKIKPKHPPESFETEPNDGILSEVSIRNSIKHLENNNGFDYKFGYNSAIDHDIALITQKIKEIQS